MPGGGTKYEAYEKGKLVPPEASELLHDVRKERIEKVLEGRTRTLSVVLDRLEDTFNMAAVLRTCEAMGIQEVHILDNPNEPFKPNPRVTQGCHKWLDLSVYKTFDKCREALHARGFKIWVSALATGATPLDSLEFDTKVALVFGNERHGVSPDVLAGADGVFWIPMQGFVQSMNISAAASAAITRAVMWRRERWNGRSGDLSPEQTTELRERFHQLSVKQHKKLYEGMDRVRRVE